MSSINPNSNQDHSNLVNGFVRDDGKPAASQSSQTAVTESSKPTSGAARRLVAGMLGNVGRGLVPSALNFNKKPLSAAETKRYDFLNSVGKSLKNPPSGARPGLAQTNNTGKTGSQPTASPPVPPVASRAPSPPRTSSPPRTPSPPVGTARPLAEVRKQKDIVPRSFVVNELKKLVQNGDIDQLFSNKGELVQTVLDNPVWSQVLSMAFQEDHKPGANRVNARAQDYDPRSREREYTLAVVNRLIDQGVFVDETKLGF